MSLIESGLASASASIGMWSLFYLFKKCRDKTSIIGAWLPVGKTYAEKNFSRDGVIFLDLDGALSVEPLWKKEASLRRLEIYPKAREKLAEYKAAYKNNSIIVCSSDYELLKFIGLRKKKTICFLPSPKFWTDNQDFFKENLKDIQALCLHTQLSSKKKRQIFFNTFDNLTDLMEKKFIK